MKPTLLSIACLCITLPLHAGWLVPADGGRIKYTVEEDVGHATFDGALKELSASGRIRRLDGINGFELFSEENFQTELFSGLERDAPRELKGAMESAGNMHNPKMHQLRKLFERTLLGTPTITKLNASLAAYGLTISQLSCEKFELRRPNENSNHRFYGSLWLTVTRSDDSVLSCEPKGIFDDPIRAFSDSLLPALSGFEKARFETTLRGFYLRADDHPGFKQETEPSVAGLYLNVAVRDPAEIAGFGDVSKLVGTINERTVEFPAVKGGEMALRIVFKFGSQANPEAVKSVGKDIEKLIHAWKKIGEP